MNGKPYNGTKPDIDNMPCEFGLRIGEPRYGERYLDYDGKTWHTHTKGNMVGSLGLRWIRDAGSFSPMDTIDSDAEALHMTDMDVFVAWKMGCAVYQKAKKMGARWPHE